MSVTDIYRKSNRFRAITASLRAWVPVITIILVGLTAFGLGKLSVYSEVKTDMVVCPPPLQTLTGTIIQEGEVRGAATEKQYVASKNGEKYYYIWCSGAERIKEENRVYFSTSNEAQNAGYDPASNCPGLNKAQ